MAPRGDFACLSTHVPEPRHPNGPRSTSTNPPTLARKGPRCAQRTTRRAEFHLGASRKGERFPDKSLPKVVFTGRGLGFFHPNGAITAEWQAGLKAAGLRAYQGENAGSQPGQIGDVLLHETAVAWLRTGLTATTPKSPETETAEEYYARLLEVCADVNRRCDVKGLCKGFLPGAFGEGRREGGCARLAGSSGTTRDTSFSF